MGESRRRTETERAREKTRVRERGRQTERKRLRESETERGRLRERLSDKSISRKNACGGDTKGQMRRFDSLSKRISQGWLTTLICCFRVKQASYADLIQLKFSAVFKSKKTNTSTRVLQQQLAWFRVRSLSREERKRDSVISPWPCRPS